jgi:hypothetical protein
MSPFDAYALPEPCQDDGTVIGASNALADRLGLDRIERLETIDRGIRLPMNKSIWPPEVWAEMQAIARGEA